MDRMSRNEERLAKAKMLNRDQFFEVENLVKQGLTHDAALEKVSSAFQTPETTLCKTCGGPIADPHKA